ncbi:hypothetical protein [Streptomyces sp. NPDC003015]
MDWAEITERLRVGVCPRRVYAPRGDMFGFLAALGVERADVVGHSLGGIVPYLLAQPAPGVVRRLVLEDVPAPIPLDPPRPPTCAPETDPSFDRAQRPRPRVVGPHGADHHAHAADRGRSARPISQAIPGVR